MIESEISEILNSFVPITLGEMDSVELMDRVETKYVFSVKKLPELLKRFSANYKALDINDLRNFPYYTTYLDTPELLFYTQQITDKLNRHKIRYRLYESTGISFLEIKMKTNKERTIKWRIENYSDSCSPDDSASAFIKEYLPYNSLDLHTALINRFTRITLVGININERITLDYNISFSESDGKVTQLPFLAIAELKSERYVNRSMAGIVLRQNGIRPVNFSKYSFGSALIKDIPRKNALKPKFLLINKIKNEYNESCRA
jgi:hypothetical protein